MPTIDEAEQLVARLTPAEKRRLLQSVASDLARLGRAPPSIPALPDRISKTPGVCGGAACIRNTRIAVWMLIRHKQLGHSETDLLVDYPGLEQADLDAAWSYYRDHTAEIDETIEDEEREED